MTINHARLVGARIGAGAIAVLVMAALPDAASAQSTKPCSTLGAYIGAAWTPTGDPALSGGVEATWGLTPRVGAEARMTWFDRPAGESAMAGSLSAIFRVPTGGPGVPFLRAGAGLFAVTIDLGRSTPPEFYARRIAGEPLDTRHSFTDLLLAFGGGVDVLASRSVSWRPEVEVHMVVRDGRVYTVTTASMQLSWHFERPVAPARSR